MGKKNRNIYVGDSVIRTCLFVFSFQENPGNMHLQAAHSVDVSSSEEMGEDSEVFLVRIPQGGGALG